MKLFSAFVSGLLFGIGLIIAQMTDPKKVLAFLDVTGQWDPSLILVMVAGLIVFSLGYFYLVKPLQKPLLADKFFIPKRKTIDKKLILGAVLFGLGWGLTGICPGPALTNTLTFEPKILAFIVAMLLGMFTARLTITKPMTTALNKKTS
jgi:hypothetical protein